MIRIIRNLKARPADRDQQLRQLPLVPASGTLRTEIEDTDSGLQTRNSLSFRLHSSAAALHDILYAGLVLLVEFEDGTSLYVGTDDLPVMLRISEGDTLDVSAEHISAPE